MSDNFRRYLAILEALTQCYPGQPSGTVARHLSTLAALISGIVGSKSTQLPHIATKVPDGTKPESRVKRFARWCDNAHILEEVYFLPYADVLLRHLALQTVVLVMDGSGVGRGCTALMIHVDTVATLLDHVYPRRVLCNVSVVCSRPSARDSRSMSRAIRPSKHALPRTRYTLFCIFRWRRLPRSTALDVAGNSVSSRNVNAFSRFVENTLFNVSPIHLKRLIHCRSFRNLPRAVWVRQRRSNKAYM